MSDSRQQVWDVYAKAMELFDQKNADYGDAWRTNGWRGNLSRIFEKVQRVRNLAWRPDPRVPAVGDEQVLATLQDLLNTTAFAIINMIEEVEYGHEVPRSQRFSELGQGYTHGEAMAFYDRVGAELPHVTFVATEAADAGEPVTTRIMVDPRMVQQVDELSLMTLAADEPLPVGPDEQGAAEKKHDPRPQRRKTTPVRDNPQA